MMLGNMHCGNGIKIDIFHYLLNVWGKPGSNNGENLDDIK